MTWLKENILLLIAPITSVFVYLFTKRHYQKLDLKEKTVNINDISTDVLLKNFTLHLKMIDDIERRYEAELKKSEAKMREMEEKYEEELRKNQLKITGLEEKIQELKILLEKHINKK